MLSTLSTQVCQNKGYFPAFPPSMQEELAWSWVLMSWVLGMREANQGSVPHPSHASIQHAHTRRDMEMELQPETESKEGQSKPGRWNSERAECKSEDTLSRCVSWGLGKLRVVAGAAGVCQGLYQAGHKENPSGSMGV